MTPESFLEFSMQVGFVLLSLAFLATVFRVIKGPTLPDRIIALDLLVAAAIGFIAILAIRTGFTLYLDIAIALGLVGFLATVAFARFVLNRGKTEEQRDADLSSASGLPKPAMPTATKPPEPGTVSAAAQDPEKGTPVAPKRARKTTGAANGPKRRSPAKGKADKP